MSLCFPIILLFLLSVSFVNVNLMTIRGPALTTYDPCGLGVLNFDRTNDEYWNGVLHFGLYSNLVEVETKIYFEKPVIILKEGDNKIPEVRRSPWSSLMVKRVKPIPEKYHFQVQVVDGNETDVPVVLKFILNNVTLCSNEIKASQTIKSLNVSSTNYGNHYAHVCGRRSLRHTELVSVRTEAKAGDWPWHVALLIKQSASSLANYDCGGNIISRTAVLTAGHCIFKNGKLLEPEHVTVIAGTNNYTDLYQAGRQVLAAQKLILHPAYTYEYSTSDLGIIKVDRFVYTEFVQPICLWGPTYDKTLLFGKEATVVGFGFTDEDKPSEVLRSSNLKVQNDSTCIQFQPNIYQKMMNEFTFCAGYGPSSSVNPRNGDSGGGLVLSTLQSDHRISWFLRGVLSKCGVSPGQVACDPTYYVIYTDVGPHYGWINHHSGLQFRVNVS